MSYGLLLRAPRGHGTGQDAGPAAGAVPPHDIPGYPGTARGWLPAALLPVKGAGDTAVSLGRGDVAAASGGGKGLPLSLE